MVFTNKSASSYSPAVFNLTDVNWRPSVKSQLCRLQFFWDFQLEGLCFSLTFQLQFYGGFIAGSPCGTGEFLGAVNRLAIERRNDVVLLHTGFFCSRPF